ncbi:EamA family transporter RarD [Poseidonibacter ostreae]|uniref:EamA family transporter RarD n=1 Tax=Poseidonibacter ostreae TaxID=2654171 RepID=A0A6L4WUV3_9BACT|nr:EamA family transporter RarD [Poseidonibacter ostreae]KAB7885904.1 EamA family transporter RarD [Poseidonibacter ostreae]KAB7889381.1 EamA family transporter RarD [Poseidonibacter ostreae]KAB7891657.1 EamA family transporter RarD [Poseidonibacter ostreae]
MNENRLGQVYAVLAFLFWGAIAPIYFKQVSSVEPLEVLIHRIFWSFIILIPLLFITKQVDIFKIIIKDVKKLKYLAFSTFFISLNWLVFIWAVTNERIMETAFGYYINPLVSVFLGYVFFGERMTRYQNFAILIAFLAVLYQLISLGSLPLVSLTLALSFAFYGMIRKKINVGSIVGLFIETLILMPFALLGIYYLMINDKISFLNSSEYINIMLSLGGIITITPLLLFNGAATRMKLSTLGFFQYLGPTCAFLLAIFIYKEEFNSDKLITFSLIWLALVIFSLDSLNTKNKNKKSKESNS